MGYLKYKGYTGSVEYSEEDKCLFGKVQGMMRDGITYEGETFEKLTKDFEGAIDDYLQMCEEKGITPRKPYTGVLNVRLSPEMHSGAAMAASKEDITIMHSSGMPLPVLWACRSDFPAQKLAGQAPVPATQDEKALNLL